MMHPQMVYGLPTWLQAFAVIGAAVLGAVVLEITARHFIRQEVRQQHNDVAAAMFGVIGTTFAVLLAFVVMFTFEGYGNARTAVATEAAVALEVADAAAGLPVQSRIDVRQRLAHYLQLVIGTEWPAQAAGRQDDSAGTALAALIAQAALVRPVTAGDSAYQAALIIALARLQDARAMRQATAAKQVPSVVWTVVLLGGVLTVGAGSFLGAPSLAMHMAMSATLAASGALVVVLIVALSQPYRGDFKIPTTPYQSALGHLDVG
jgi:hypothetical protein